MVRHFNCYILLLIEFKLNKIIDSILNVLCKSFVCNLGTFARLEAINN